MLKYVVVLAAVISGCVFGSISNFSERDIKDAENVVHNSSFEQGEEEAKLPDGWMVLNKLENTVSWDKKTALTGSKSLKITHAKDRANIISDSFPLDPEMVYFTRCSVKTNYQSNHAVIIRFLTFDAKGKQLDKFAEKFYPETDWTILKLTTGFFKTSARFGRIIVSFPAKSDKEYWVDDVESYSVYKIQK